MTKDPTDYKTAYYDLMLTDRVNLRERIVMLLGAGWISSVADNMYDWITNEPKAANWDKKTAGIPPWEEAASRANKILNGKKRGPKKGVKRGPYKKTGKRVFNHASRVPRKKRAYNKKSTFWKKKRK